MEKIYVVVNRAGKIYGAFTEYSSPLGSCVRKAIMENDVIIVVTYVGEELHGETYFRKSDFQKENK